MVKNLVQNGYWVHATVRDASREDKVSYLEAMDAEGPGSVVIFEADLEQANEGAYDAAFAGCSAVFHVAADLFSDSAYGAYDGQRQYDSIVTATEGVLASCLAAGSVQRVIYTSSCAGVFGPPTAGGGPLDGHEFTEADFAGGSIETLDERWTFTTRSGRELKLWNVERQPYAKGKVDAEILCYEWGEEHGIDVVTSNPCHVLGPLLGASQNTGWQGLIGRMLEGNGAHDDRHHEMWNVTDVRDIAEMQRLAAESDVCGNGSRYMNVALDPSALMGVNDFIAFIQGLYPDIDVAGDYVSDPTPEAPIAFSRKVVEDFGIPLRSCEDTLRSTVDSLIELGCVTPKPRGKL